MVGIQKAIRILNHAADKLILDVRDPHCVSRAFGYGKDDYSSRIQAGVICRNLANELETELINFPEIALS